MPAKLTRNQYLDGKRLIKAKKKVTNDEIVKVMKTKGDSTVSFVRKARSFPHYQELVRESNRAAKARREARKKGSQQTLLDETRSETRQPSIQKHDSAKMKQAVKTTSDKALQTLQDQAEVAVKKGHRVVEIEVELLGEVIKKVFSMERSIRGLYANDRTHEKCIETNRTAINEINNRLALTPSFEETPLKLSESAGSPRRKKRFGIF